MSDDSTKRIVLAIGGSSGSIYAYQLIRSLAQLQEAGSVAIVISDNAITNWELEIGAWMPTTLPFKVYDSKDFHAPFASGSSSFRDMVICPCSMGLIGRIAHGISNDLITRAADVMLKEKGNLIVVPRETPLNLIHLRNLTTLSEAGAIICPAIPSFYSKPESIEEVISTVTDRILRLLGLDHHGYRWGED